ncbi:predicted protein [Phaeodactylum tricornutum CCAP 1055/1]|uniref:Uncharacterized protein n=2 Tax=Phaeodactylum tricornutum TaxID=2850 RepID=B7GB19_PHATC|nr:predicted protein [Phaeodactylum tricornutum CCAP 1055/1]EEC44043.1 predicted protein [Phaeodactylum tricornutum CCAP 1055/1]|eukprot:XP_002184294.1 predicted protein [Phaeodactylum tricornutum CCAP 1055/1]
MTISPQEREARRGVQRENSLGLIDIFGDRAVVDPYATSNQEFSKLASKNPTERRSNNLQGSKSLHDSRTSASLGPNHRRRQMQVESDAIMSGAETEDTCRSSASRIRRSGERVRRSKGRERKAGVSRTRSSGTPRSLEAGLKTTLSHESNQDSAQAADDEMLLELVEHRTKERSRTGLVKVTQRTLSVRGESRSARGYRSSELAPVPRSKSSRVESTDKSSAKESVRLRKIPDIPQDVEHSPPEVHAVAIYRGKARVSKRGPSSVTGHRRRTDSNDSARSHEKPRRSRTRREHTHAYAEKTGAGKGESASPRRRHRSHTHSPVRPPKSPRRHRQLSPRKVLDSPSLAGDEEKFRPRLTLKAPSLKDLSLDEQSPRSLTEAEGAWLENASKGDNSMKQKSQASSEYESEEESTAGRNSNGSVLQFDPSQSDNVYRVKQVTRMDSGLQIGENGQSVDVSIAQLCDPLGDAKPVLRARKELPIFDFLESNDDAMMTFTDTDPMEVSHKAVGLDSPSGGENSDSDGIDVNKFQMHVMSPGVYHSSDEDRREARALRPHTNLTFRSSGGERGADEAILMASPNKELPIYPSGGEEEEEDAVREEDKMDYMVSRKRDLGLPKTMDCESESFDFVSYGSDYASETDRSSRGIRSKSRAKSQPSVLGLSSGGQGDEVGKVRVKKQGQKGRSRQSARVHPTLKRTSTTLENADLGS